MHSPQIMDNQFYRLMELAKALIKTGESEPKPSAKLISPKGETISTPKPPAPFRGPVELGKKPQATGMIKVETPRIEKRKPREELFQKPQESFRGKVTEKEVTEPKPKSIPPLTPHQLERHPSVRQVMAKKTVEPFRGKVDVGSKFQKEQATGRPIEIPKESFRGKVELERKPLTPSLIISDKQKPTVSGKIQVVPTRMEKKPLKSEVVKPTEPFRGKVTESSIARRAPITSAVTDPVSASRKEKMLGAARTLREKFGAIPRSKSESPLTPYQLERHPSATKIIPTQDLTAPSPVKEGVEGIKDVEPDMVQPKGSPKVSQTTRGATQSGRRYGRYGGYGPNILGSYGMGHALGSATVSPSGGAAIPNIYAGRAVGATHYLLNRRTLPGREAARGQREAQIQRQQQIQRMTGEAGGVVTQPSYKSFTESIDLLKAFTSAGREEFVSGEQAKRAYERSFEKQATGISGGDSPDLPDRGRDWHGTVEGVPDEPQDDELNEGKTEGEINDGEHNVQKVWENPKIPFQQTKDVQKEEDSAEGGEQQQEPVEEEDQQQFTEAPQQQVVKSFFQEASKAFSGAPRFAQGRIAPPREKTWLLINGYSPEEVESGQVQITPRMRGEFNRWLQNTVRKSLNNLKTKYM